MMVIIAILIGACPPIGLIALIIYIIGKDHGISADSVVATFVIIGICFVLIACPIIFIGSILTGAKQSISTMVLCGFVTVAEVIALTILLHKEVLKQNHKLDNDRKDVLK